MPAGQVYRILLYRATEIYRATVEKLAVACRDKKLCTTVAQAIVFRGL